MKIEKILQLTQDVTLTKQVIFNVAYSQNYILEKISETLKPYDVSLEQFNVLRILRGQKGKPANMGAIQERMLAKTSNTTRLVDKLLAKKYVTRTVCSENRRKIEVKITKEGLKLLEIVDGLVEEAENKLVANFTEQEKEKLVELLEKFRN